MRVVLLQIPVSARAKDQERPRISGWSREDPWPVSSQLHQPASGAYSCQTLPLSRLPPGLARLPSEGGTSGSEEGQGLKEGVMEEWGVWVRVSWGCMKEGQQWVKVNTRQ